MKARVLRIAGVQDNTGRWEINKIKDVQTGPIWQMVVENHPVVVLACKVAEGVTNTERRVHLASTFLELNAEEFLNIRIIFDDEDAHQAS